MVALSTRQLEGPEGDMSFSHSTQSESFSAEPLTPPGPVCMGLTSHHQMVSATLNGRRTQGAD